jgi:hypothetical protein
MTKAEAEADLLRWIDAADRAGLDAKEVFRAWLGTHPERAALDQERTSCPSCGASAFYMEAAGHSRFIGCFSCGRHTIHNLSH